MLHQPRLVTNSKSHGNIYEVGNLDEWKSHNSVWRRTLRCRTFSRFFRWQCWEVPHENNLVRDVRKVFFISAQRKLFQFTLSNVHQKDNKPSDFVTYWRSHVNIVISCSQSLENIHAHTHKFKAFLAHESFAHAFVLL